jgi:hypothetical protein
MKWIIRIVVLLLLLVVVVLGVALWQVDGLVRSGVERGVGYATQTDTQLAEADLGLLSSSLSLGGLTIGQPEGFAGEPFLTLDDVDVAIDVKSLTTDTVQVQRLTLDGLTIRLMREDGQWNHDAILEALERFSGESAADDEAPGKDVNIQQIDITNVTAIAVLELVSGEPREIELTLDRVPVDSVQTGSKTSMASVAAGVIQAVIIDVLPQIIAESGGLIGDEAISLVNQRLPESMQGVFDERIQNVVGDLGGEAGEAVNRVLEGGGAEAIGGILGGLGGGREQAPDEDE